MHRSFSLAAKLCYQRQRMVQAEIREAVQEKTTWQKLRSWREGVLSVLDKLG